MSSILDVEKVRSQFPALKSGFIFGDNAGGSQILQQSIHRLVDYLTNTNVQMGSDYLIASTRRCLKESQEHAVELFNAASANEIVFGGSSTQNLENLARGLEHDIRPGDEIIITGEHEANGGPWKSLAKRTGATIKTWPWRRPEGDSFEFGLYVEELLPLITANTRILAFTACSNILGTLTPVKTIVTEARKTHQERGGKKLEISLDCVAYAPHHRMDVRDWDVDFCVFSFYKVYGPHISAMYVRKASLESSVQSVVHHFLSPGVDGNGYKLQPMGAGYESAWGTTALVPYVKSLTSEGTLEAGFAAMKHHDLEIAQQILDFLTSSRLQQRGVRVIGSKSTENGDRMPTVAFIVLEGANGERAMTSKSIVGEMDKFGKSGIRYGHFYAYTLVSSIYPGIDPNDGVVRISYVHYNTHQEIETVISLLEKILFPS